MREDGDFPSFSNFEIPGQCYRLDSTEAYSSPNYVASFILRVFLSETFFHLFNKLESFSIKFIKRRLLRRGSLLSVFLFFLASLITQQRNLFINLNYTFVHQIVLKMNFVSASFFGKNLILFVWETFADDVS